jgi:DNA-binding response OmpR family regulator
VKELLARIEAVMRRSPERPDEVSKVKFPGGVADLARREVRLDGGKREELTDREVTLLKYLAANPGRAISRDEILTRVWRLDPRGIDTRTIDMHVARLREKLHDDPDEPAIILTVRGVGYMYGETKT